MYKVCTGMNCQFFMDFGVAFGYMQVMPVSPGNIYTLVSPNGEVLKHLVIE